jgi:hypothetical protein
VKKGAERDSIERNAQVTFDDAQVGHVEFFVKKCFELGDEFIGTAGDEEVIDVEHKD